MQLTLTYRGPLHAQTKKDGRIAEKHKIRREFHKQMREAWRTHPALEGIFKAEINGLAVMAPELVGNPDRFIPIFDLGGFQFAPLINRGNWLACELDILFLRCEPPGYIVDGESGDIDNRIKVLFDALRMPLQADELPAMAKPDETEHPFFCLLADDSLITAFRLDS